MRRWDRLSLEILLSTYWRSPNIWNGVGRPATHTHTSCSSPFCRGRPYPNSPATAQFVFFQRGNRKLFAYRPSYRHTHTEGSYIGYYQKGVNRIHKPTSWRDSLTILSNSWLMSSFPIQPPHPSYDSPLTSSAAAHRQHTHPELISYLLLRVFGLLVVSNNSLLGRQYY